MEALYRKGVLKPDHNQDGTKTVRIMVNDCRVSVLRLDRHKFYDASKPDIDDRDGDISFLNGIDY